MLKHLLIRFSSTQLNFHMTIFSFSVSTWCFFSYNFLSFYLFFFFFFCLSSVSFFIFLLSHLFIIFNFSGCRISMIGSLKLVVQNAHKIQKLYAIILYFCYLFNTIYAVIIFVRFYLHFILFYLRLAMKLKYAKCIYKIF